jgi:hypothetical protein
LLHRLGLPVLPNLSDKLCECGKPLSNFAHHQHCAKERRLSVTVRHDVIARDLCNFASAAGIGHILEPHNSEHHLRPDFVLFGHGTPILVDVSVASPESKTVVKYAANTTLYAATTREKAKHKKYEDIIAAEKRPLTAFVTETHGGAAEEKGVASKADYEMEMKRHLSFQIQRGNGRIGRALVTRLNKHWATVARDAARKAAAAVAPLAAAPSAAAAPKRGRGRPRKQQS